MKGISSKVINYPVQKAEKEIINPYAIIKGKNKNIFKREYKGEIYELEIDKFLFFAYRIYDDGTFPANKSNTLISKYITGARPVYEHSVEVYISRYFAYFDKVF